MARSTLAGPVEELIVAVWTQTLDLPLAVSAVAPRAGAVHTIEAWVHVSSTWRGTIIVQCSMALVRRAMQRMFRLDGVG